ncbi:MAG: hypothetical protein IJT75_10405, partial [Bacteroidaceae bacterium]|nr:hypothetical protein [Bacteroidaceae bacterium]
AATAVLLCGPATVEPTTYTLNYTQEGSYAGPNLLHGSDVATTTTGGEVYYKLTYGSASGHEDVFGWYWGEEEGAAFSIGAHKAWLAITREQAGLDGGTPVKSFGLSGNVTDGLPNMEGFGQTKQLSEPYYHDLQGRRVSRPASGLYIVNGKKIAIM